MKSARLSALIFLSLVILPGCGEGGPSHANAGPVNLVTADNNSTRGTATSKSTEAVPEKIKSGSNVESNEGNEGNEKPPTNGSESYVQGKPIGIWLGRLKSPNPWIRQDSAKAIGSGGQSALAAAPGLAEALNKDSSSDVRRAAAIALGLVQASDHRSTSALADALSDKDEHVRDAAAFSLGKIGPAARGAFTRLQIALKDPSARVRGNAAFALGRTGVAQESTGDLIEMLKDVDPYARYNAAVALGRLGPKGEPATKALQAASADGSPMVRSYALFAAAATPASISLIIPGHKRLK